jgi:hypothetical protein
MTIGGHNSASLEKCDHYYVYHVSRGCSIRICRKCNTPDWDELQKLFEYKRAARVAEDKLNRMRKILEAYWWMTDYD